MLLLNPYRQIVSLALLPLSEVSGNPRFQQIFRSIVRIVTDRCIVFHPSKGHSQPSGLHGNMTTREWILMSLNSKNVFMT